MGKAEYAPHVVQRSDTPTDSPHTKIDTKDKHDERVADDKVDSRRVSEGTVDESHNGKPPPNEMLKFLRGAVAGTVAKATVYPLDRFKMVFQVKGYGASGSTGPGRHYDLARLRWGPFLNQVENSFKKDGLRGLWRGNLTSSLRTFAHSGIVFRCFEIYHGNLMQWESLDGHDAIRRLLAGGSAGVTSTCITYPLDVWNTRMAVTSGALTYQQVAVYGDAKRHSHQTKLQRVNGRTSGRRRFCAVGTPLHCSANETQMRRRHNANGCGGGRRQHTSPTCRISNKMCKIPLRSCGLRSNTSVVCETLPRWRALFVAQFGGFIPTLTGIFPYAGISFLTFETLKQRIKDQTGQVELSPYTYLICGGTAGVVSQTATYPLDTVRKYMQTDHFLREIRDTGFRHRDVTPMGTWRGRFFGTFRHIYLERGVRGFFNGVTLNWVKGFCAPGVSFMLHELMRDWQEDRVRI